MPDTPLIDIRPDHWEIVRDILARHVKEHVVWAFGSRAKWTAKPHSDLDLAVISDTPLSVSTFASLTEDFSESDLPYKVDVVDWATTSDAFRDIIKTVKTLVWPEMVKLSEVASFLSGGTPSKSQPQYWSGDIPWLTPKDMSSFDGHTQDCVTRLALGNGTKMAPENAIFMAVRGMSLHNEIRFVMPAQALAFNQDIKAIVPNGINREYLYYYLQAQSPHLLSLVESSGHGTGVFPTDRLIDLKILNFDIKIQTEIGSLFSTLDNKIELNRQVNETLESMARAIFKDWFVDFGPTRAKMEGRAPYLAPNIWSLFPDRLDDDGRPEGWTIALLGAVTSQLRRGVTPKYVNNRGICVLNQKCVRGHDVNFGPSRRHDASVRSVTDRELIVGDVLINSTGVGTLGRIAQLWHLPEPTIVDTHITVARANTSVTSPEFLGAYLLSREADIEAMGEGSTGQTELSREKLARMPVLNPSSGIHLVFSSVVSGIYTKMIANQLESQTLAQTRDLLLPKLMSGEIRIRDAEQAVEAAL